MEKYRERRRDYLRVYISRLPRFVPFSANSRKFGEFGNFRHHFLTFLREHTGCSVLLEYMVYNER